MGLLLGEDRRCVRLRRSRVRAIVEGSCYHSRSHRSGEELEQENKIPIEQLRVVLIQVQQRQAAQGRDDEFQEMPAFVRVTHQAIPHVAIGG